eukprot:scaffold45088_cov16-Tisochrysis_lutea.AAC.3
MNLLGAGTGRTQQQVCWDMPLVHNSLMHLCPKLNWRKRERKEKRKERKEKKRKEKKLNTGYKSTLARPPNIYAADPAEERALAAQTHMEHEVDVAASYVQQLVRHAGRVASRAAQTMGLPEGVEAEKSRDASRK